MDVNTAREIYNRYKTHKNMKIEYFKDPVEAEHPYEDTMGMGEIMIFTVKKFMATVVFTNKAVYYQNFINEKKRCPYMDIYQLEAEKAIGNVLINNETVDLGESLYENDERFFKNLGYILREYKQIINREKSSGSLGTMYPTENHTFTPGKKKIINNIQEVLSDKSFSVYNDKLYAYVYGLSEKDIIYTIFILKSIYAFYVDAALSESRTCCLRISYDMEKNPLYKPYMQSNNERVFVSYDDEAAGTGFYITGRNIYYYTQKNMQKSITLYDIDKLIIHGDSQGLHICFNDEKDCLFVSKDSEAVAMLFCILCYLKSTSGVYSLIRHIENFAKASAMKSLNHFTTTVRLQRDKIDKMGMAHFTEINPKECIASMDTPTLNMLLTINGLYLYAKLGNAPMQKLFVDGIDMKKAIASISRFQEKTKMQKAVKAAGYLMGGSIGGMIGGWVGDAVVKKSHYYCLDINDRERLMMDADTTLSDTACMCLLLNVYSNIGRA